MQKIGLSPMAEIIPDDSEYAGRCMHCRDALPESPYELNGLAFCCQGCAVVYDLLIQNNLCDYYQLDQNLHTTSIEFEKEKYAFLDLAEIRQKLIRYQDDTQTRVLFKIPGIHCSSCIYLLENMYKIHPGFLNTHLNFPRKELTVAFDHHVLSLRQVVEWLCKIGYEPYLSLEDLQSGKSNSKSSNHQNSIRLGIAAFAFGNIMLLSFPEYLGATPEQAYSLDIWFRYLALILSLPVVFYSAGPFFQSAATSLRRGLVNIDAPIALAIAVTFVRSVYEVVFLDSGGYFDSMSGIVFFMLLGRYVQDRTYTELTYERDYKSYFPVAVMVQGDDGFQPKSLEQLIKNDLIRIGPGELIPADGILVRGTAYLDYSFVTGEADIIEKNPGGLLFAGAKNEGDFIEMQLLRSVSHSYLTSLWNRDIFSTEKAKKDQWIDRVSKHFSWVVLVIAGIDIAYWALNDPEMIWPTFTAILIIACPCTLLLTATFTNGFILNTFARQGFYLRSATFLEVLANPDRVVLDKTGTLTSPADHMVVYEGQPFTIDMKLSIASLARRSSHPLSKIISGSLLKEGDSDIKPEYFKEYAGRGIEGSVGRMLIRIGSPAFTGCRVLSASSVVCIQVDGMHMGNFHIAQNYRKGVGDLFTRLKSICTVQILSGDNEQDRGYLTSLAGPEIQLDFKQTPVQKLEKIEAAQVAGDKVIMIGDGLNDAGALKQSDLGIALTQSMQQFTPASDGIMRADQLSHFDKFINMASAGRTIIKICFGYSILYNIAGICLAVMGMLSPLAAAIIMPASSLSVILFSWILVKQKAVRTFGK